ncbi:MAG: NADPH:quinone oxidoreductase family protein [Cyclobacteriaceae bacterium]
MKAYVLKKTGKPEILKLVDVVEPKCATDGVKVKVERIGINYAEILSRRGQYRWAPKRPYIPGMECYGEIVEVGEQVSQHKVGDKVIVGSQYGAYAEFVSAPAYLALPAPDKFTASEAAAFLVNFMTAWVALVKLGRMRAGDVSLVHAAAGGVGTAAIQIGKAIGATMIGTASNEEKLKLIRDYGADLAINYATTNFAKTIRAHHEGVDIVLEVVGGEVFRKSMDLLNPFGRLVVTGYASIPLKLWNPLTYWKTWKDAPKASVMDMAIKSNGLMATHLGYLTDNPKVVKEEWGALSSFCQAHDLKPLVGKEFMFDDMAKAHSWMESRQSVGKIIVKI